MATGNLPPQAYTRETLTAAFNWLQSQPESMRKAATSPDTLVALFTRAQRFGSSSLESDAPVSSQAFMSDLKNLAEGLKQFEDPETQRTEPPRTAMPSEMRADHRPDPRVEPQAPPRARPARGPAQQPYLQPQHAHPQQQVPPQFAPPPPPPQYHASFQAPPSFQPPPPQFMPPNLGYAPSPNFVQALNDRSLAMVQDVRDQLNLSTDAEAVNLMVALAYKSLRTLLV